MAFAIYQKSFAKEEMPFATDEKLLERAERGFKKAAKYFGKVQQAFPLMAKVCSSPSLIHQIRRGKHPLS
jgi:hypothetical protein